jgi:hypothetical protein
MLCNALYDNKVLKEDRLEHVGNEVVLYDHVLQCACLRLFCPRPKIINRICRATRTVPVPTPHPNSSLQINSIILNKFRVLLEVHDLSEDSRDLSLGAATECLRILLLRGRCMVTLEE